MVLRQNSCILWAPSANFLRKFLLLLKLNKIFLGNLHPDILIYFNSLISFWAVLPYDFIDFAKKTSAALSPLRVCCIGKSFKKVFLIPYVLNYLFPSGWNVFFISLKQTSYWKKRRKIKHDLISPISSLFFFGKSWRNH